MGNPLVRVVDIRHKAHEQLKASRNIDNRLAREDFQRLIKTSTDEEYAELEVIVATLDSEKLKRWQRRHSSRLDSDLSISELRHKAAQLQIKNAARMPIDQLKVELDKYVS